jgi:hypothetical protein
MRSIAYLGCGLRTATKVVASEARWGIVTSFSALSSTRGVMG